MSVSRAVIFKPKGRQFNEPRHVRSDIHTLTLDVKGAAQKIYDGGLMKYQLSLQNIRLSCDHLTFIFFQCVICI